MAKTWNDIKDVYSHMQALGLLVPGMQVPEMGEILAIATTIRAQAREGLRLNNLQYLRHWAAYRRQPVGAVVVRLETALQKLGYMHGLGQLLRELTQEGEGVRD